MEPLDATRAAVSDPGDLPLVELGWVLIAPTGALSRAALEEAIGLVSGYLKASLPEFDWRMSLVVRHDSSLGVPVEPTALLDIGVMERDAAHWDFALVVTEAPLLSHEKPFMLGAPAPLVDVAVLSTARLDPAVSGRTLLTGEPQAGPAAGKRQDTLARRVAALVMHLFGHLNDLSHSDNPRDFLFDLRGEKDLDGMQELSAEGRERLRDRLGEVADPRLEETARDASTFVFYVQALWVNRSEVWAAIRRIAPWKFPFHYSGLTTASASTLLILVMTAEAWELGMSQPAWRVCLLSAVSLLATSYYIVLRQHLISRLGHHRTEQRVVTIVSTTVGVMLGMLTTYVLLFASTWVAAQALFSAQLVREWAASVPAIRQAHYFTFAAFVASAGILIGALGASFEKESYFRRIAMLGEET
jgi:hypothetical protein